MKKIFKPLIAIIVVGGISSFIAYSANKKEKEQETFLLRNVEALTRGENDSDRATCGTKSVYVNNTIKCNVCGSNTGFVGIEYSRTTGDNSTYKVGKKGVDTSCTPYHGTKSNVDTVKEKKC